MREALIGHTGFVGSNLKQAGWGTEFYNSKNSQDMAGQRFDHVVCVGVSAVKWWANQNPEADWAGIQALIDVLERVETSYFTLISTIDVYPDPSAPLTESADLSILDNHAYGKNRLKFEAWVKENFAYVTIIRLPALFGDFLKKNALFDLLHGNAVENINPLGVFQWYPLSLLSNDIKTVHKFGEELVNLFPAPLAMERILTLFPDAKVGAPKSPAPRYDVRTQHADLFGKKGGYRLSEDEVWNELLTFVKNFK
jgi:hypothetical protein